MDLKTGWISIRAFFFAPPARHAAPSALHARAILFNSIFSVRQSGWFLHARSDHSDINLKTVEFLRRLEGFRFHAVIGRKIPEIFTRKHNGSATEFYFDLIHKLLALHPLKEDTTYHLFLSQRHSNTDQRFTEAAMQHHYEQILDVYEADGYGRLYTRENQFELEKASPFILGAKK